MQEYGSVKTMSHSHLTRDYRTFEKSCMNIVATIGLSATEVNYT